MVTPIQLRRRGVEAKLVIRATGQQSREPDIALVELLHDAYRWIDDLTAGHASSLRDIARQCGRDVGEVSRTLPLAFLAPDIVALIIEDGHSIELVPRHLKRMHLAADWVAQRRQLGLTAGSQSRTRHRSEP